jgi:filamentous hemagglutinin family protein
VAKALFSCVLRQLGVAPLFQISLSTLGYLFLTSDVSLAQVTSDGTVNTQVNQNGNVAEITGGETRGGNLFHSFRDFSVGTGDTASFLNSNDIANIFSRVTGGNISNIDGLIRANGSANLFLINPAGILFGENARLDVGGSFYGSTADSILFEDGEFSATDLNNPPVLTINAPIGLGFRDQPGDITNNSVANNGRGLEVNPGNNISLLGGNVNFDGGRIFAPGGIVNLGGLTSAGTLNFADDGSLSFSDNVVKSNVSLTDNAVVDITSGGGGLITVNANNLELTNNSNSLFLADIGAGLGSENAVAGTINIDATKIFANNGSIIQAENSGIGKAGTININTDILDFKTGSAIVASNFGQGDAGIVNVNARNISFDQEWGGIFTTTGLQRIQTEPLVSEAVGNAGEININTDTLKLTNGAQLQVNSVAQGDAGNIDINATGTVDFIGQGETGIQPDFKVVVSSGALSQVRGGTSGNSGRVTIDAGSLNLIDKGAIIVNSGTGKSNAGEIELNVRDLIFLKDEGLILSQTSNGGNGAAGNIKIDTGSLEITNSSLILADSKSQGDSGNISITASGKILLTGFQPGKLFPSQIINQLTDTANGTAGNITINARELIMEDVSFISSSNGSDTKGSAGNIDINVNRLQLTENAFINAFTNNDFDAGEITINAQTLDLFSGGKILAATDGGGNAGNINLNISGDIKIDNSIKSSAQDVDFNPDFNSQSLQLLNDRQSSPSGIYADSSENAKGNGGNIFIDSNSLSLNSGATISASTNSGKGGEITLEITDDLTLNNNSLISAEARGNNATGGNVNINANSIVAFPNENSLNGNNDIRANAQQGQGGKITINAESLFGIQKRKLDPQTNDINASSDVFGLDGTVTINTPDINPVQGTTELPNNVVEAERTTEQTCQANRETTTKNSLVVNGKGGLPDTPDQPLTSQNLIINGEVTSAYAIPEPIETSQGKIQLARGIKFTKDGGIILTPYATNNAGERIPEGRINCGQI